MSELIIKSQIKVYARGQGTMPSRVRALGGRRKGNAVDLELLREPSGKWAIVLRPVEEKA